MTEAVEGVGGLAEFLRRQRSVSGLTENLPSGAVVEESKQFIAVRVVSDRYSPRFELPFPWAYSEIGTNHSTRSATDEGASIL